MAALAADPAHTNVSLISLAPGSFATPEPGGVLIVVDHDAADGIGSHVPGTLHRINKEIVKQEVTAAGFVFESESTALHNFLGKI